MYSHLPSPPLSPSSSSSLSLSDDPSPPSSPLTGGRTLEFTPSLPSITFIDPFSASSKSTIPSTPMSKHKFAQEQLQQPSPPADFARGISTRTVRFSIAEDDPLEAERKLWEDAISGAIDNQNGTLDLTNREITHIPPSIVDMTNLVIPPRTSTFRRSHSAPASVLGKPGGRTSLGRSQTSAVGQLPLVKEEEIERTFRPSSSTTQAQAFKHELQLYLGGNLITKLPSELFHLSGLIVLSLRANRLTSVPPAIGQLVNLRELNIADNSLTHLPSEILNLPLDNLFLHTNPWLLRPKPTELDDDILNSPSGHDSVRILSTKTLNFSQGIPTLCEFALRVLISPPLQQHLPSASTLPKRTVSSLETYYHLPLCHEPGSIPPEALDTLDRILPSSLKSKRQPSTSSLFTKHSSSLKEDNATYDPLATMCASGHHITPAHSTGRFSTPCEEQYEWVSKVGSVSVRGVPDNMVPILWRGCLRGCLDFLGGEEEVVQEKETVSSELPKMFSGLSFTTAEEWDDEFGSLD